ncbi:MAG: DUF885 domain-containing protein [Chloroflexota bacterium]
MDTPSERFNQLLAEDWDFRMRDDPIQATMTGDHRFDDRMPDASEDAAERRLSRLREFQLRVGKIARGDLGPADRLNCDIYTRLLDDDIRNIEFRSYRYPIAKLWGVHTFLPDLQLSTFFNTTQDYENYVARLNGIKRYMDGIIETMQAGLDGGQIPPRVTLEGVDQAIAVHIVRDPAESVFIRPFNAFPAQVPERVRAGLVEAAKKAVETSVVPAYESLLSFFKEEYLPGSRESIAARDLPDGQAYYEFCIRHFTSLPLTAEEVHETGLGEVTRIKAEMQAVIAETGFEGDFKAFLEFLRRDPRFYAETPEALLKETGYLMKRIDGELPRLFRTLPRLPYGIRPVPEFSAAGAPTAYYMPGAGDGTIAGFYCVNTSDLKSRPLYEMEALSLHEAVPGHHLQLALQQELDLPNFRRFGGYTSFVEGWALYAERLGLEMGFYTDPYSNFGRLSYEMWRACRLVVDTGMHALGWTRQQAIDFMLENTSSTELNIINEVDRYIGWPGQALAYKIGELKIRELRARAEAELGEKFDIRAFHDVVLTSGAVPLDVLEGMVEGVMPQNER